MLCPVCQRDTEFKVSFVGPANYDPAGNIEDMVALKCDYCNVRLIRIQQEALKEMNEDYRKAWDEMVVQLKQGTYKL